MSHVSKIELKIRDLDALEEAARVLKLTLHRGRTSYKWYGQWVNDYHGSDAAYLRGVTPEQYGKCAHVLALVDKPDAYEIGVVEMPDGTFNLVFDHWGPGQTLVNQLGRNLEKLAQAYTKACAIKALQKKGFKLVQEENLANGSLKITLQGHVSL